MIFIIFIFIIKTRSQDTYLKLVLFFFILRGVVGRRPEAALIQKFIPPVPRAKRKKSRYFNRKIEN